MDAKLNSTTSKSRLTVFEPFAARLESKFAERADMTRQNYINLNMSIKKLRIQRFFEYVKAGAKSFY
jgi:hypothetical protein